MTSQTTRRSFRVAIVTFILALATTLSASADVLTPLEEVGAPGGGSGIGGQLDETARGNDLQALTSGTTVAGTYDGLLAGSGYESAAAQADAPTVAEVRSADRAVATSAQDNVLAGSGYEQPAATVAQYPTQNAQSIARIESAQAPGGILAGGTAPSARVPLEEREHAQTQQPVASAEQAPQATSPNQTVF